MIESLNQRKQPLVLVVDDDVTTRMFARQQLEQDGFFVEEVADGHSALEVFRNHRPDAVILDVLMPGKDGFSICSDIRGIPSAANIPIMMMTALEDEDSIQKAYDVGATEFTTKPVNWAIEVQRLRNMLRSARAASDVEQAKDLWERTFNSIDDIVMILDPDLRIRLSNGSTHRAVRSNEESLEGKHCYEIFQGRTSPCEKCPVLKTLHDREPNSAEMKYTRLGSTVLISSSPIFDENGNLSQLVYTAKDMSEHKRIEAEIHHAQKMEAIGTLAGGIAHDFNNLLQTILGNSQLLAMDIDVDSEKHEDVQQVIYAANRGRELTRHLLSLSRKVPSQRMDINVNDQVKQVVSLLSRTLPKMVEIKLELSERLPFIHADPGQVEQVLMNLAVNAKHAMSEGGSLVIESREIYLDQEYCQSHEEAQPGKYVQICVSDTGHGMDKATLCQIFDPFYTTKAPGEGTGLGLSVSYGIVRDHKGYILCYSEPQLGTTFKLHFPSVQKSSGLQPVDVTSAVTALPGGCETILLVEDDPAVRRLAKKILTRVGYSVTDAFDGLHALELYEKIKESIDLVLLDVVMPKMGGIECLRELKKRDANLKILIASGYSPKLSRSEAMNAGALEFIAKPYEVNEMLRTIRNALDAVIV